MDEKAAKKKKNKIPGIILLVLGLLFILGGMAVTLLGSHSDRLETEEPVDIYVADHEDEYAYTYVQYMTDSVAYYEAIDNMQFYIVMDADWNPAVICLHTDDLKEYQPYIDWLYSESYNNGPEEMRITGYAQPFDDELKQLVMEGFTENFGEGYVDETAFEDWFGDYYLQIGQKSSAYEISNAGICVILFGIVIVVIGGALFYEKPVITPADAYQNGPVIQDDKRAAGILGALLGALLGGLLWTVIGALGFVSGWIGILTIFFAYTGYQMLSHKADKMGMIVSVVFGLLVVFPAMFLSYGWSYYTAINENGYGYVDLGRALLELPGYLTKFDGWSNLIQDIVVGYVCMGVAGIYLLVGKNSKKNKKTNL